MISRAPGLKLVVETLITSLRPIGNIVLICCAFFIVFGILGVQVSIACSLLFDKDYFYYKCSFKKYGGISVCLFGPNLIIFCVFVFFFCCEKSV